VVLVNSDFNRTAWLLSQGTWSSTVSPPPVHAAPAFYDDALGELCLLSHCFDGVQWIKPLGPAPAHGSPTVYETARARTVSLEATRPLMWQRRLSPDRGPAHLVQVSCASVIPAGATLVSAAPSFVSGGASKSGPGATVEAWLGQWQPLGSHAAAVGAPAALTGTVSAPAVSMLCSGGMMTFEATTLSGSDYTLVSGRWRGNRAQLVTDYVEVSVRSRFP
jgi:hypothetical protein